MNFIHKTFSELTRDELYSLLQLRAEVFVVEQNCAYLDLDGKDADALHVLGYLNHTLVAYARVFKPGIYFKNTAIGRVVVTKNERRDGYGLLLVRQAIAAAKQLDSGPITISAQQYLEHFYQDLGFKTVSDMYLEDDIPHLEMLYL